MAKDKKKRKLKVQLLEEIVAPGMIGGIIGGDADVDVTPEKNANPDFHYNRGGDGPANLTLEGNFGSIAQDQPANMLILGDIGGVEQDPVEQANANDARPGVPVVDRGGDGPANLTLIGDFGSIAQDQPANMLILGDIGGIEQNPGEQANANDARPGVPVVDRGGDGPANLTLIGDFGSIAQDQPANMLILGDIGGVEQNPGEQANANVDSAGVLPDLVAHDLPDNPVNPNLTIMGDLGSIEHNPDERGR